MGRDDMEIVYSYIRFLAGDSPCQIILNINCHKLTMNLEELNKSNANAELCTFLLK